MASRMKWYIEQVYVELSRGFSFSEAEADGHSSLCLDIDGYAGGMGGMPIRSGGRADRHNLSMVTVELKDTSGRTERLDYPLFRDDGSAYSLPNTSWSDPSQSHQTSR